MQWYIMKDLVTADCNKITNLSKTKNCAELVYIQKGFSLTCDVSDDKYPLNVILN